MIEVHDTHATRARNLHESMISWKSVV